MYAITASPRFRNPTLENSNLGKKRWEDVAPWAPGKLMGKLESPEKFKRSDTTWRKEGAMGTSCWAPGPEKRRHTESR